jgi:HK97 family phage prohead protease
MPYYIEEGNPDCEGFATVKEDGEVLGCHVSKQDAIDQALAIALSEGSTYEGERKKGNPKYKRAEPDALDIGDFVSWGSSGGRARGRIERIERDGSINVPDSDFTITGTEADPAALIRIYRPVEGGWNATDTLVGHLFSTLRQIDPLPAPPEDRDLPDNYRPALSEDVPEGRACGNCMFYDETRVSENGTQAWCQRWEEFVDGGFYCNAWEGEGEQRQVDLVAPSYMRAAARQGLRYYDQGLGGDGLVDRTITEARQMARGDALTPDKWVRTAAWIARHLVDLDAPGANPDDDAYPTPGVVAHLLWGSGPSKRSALRAMEYAEGVVARLEAENEGRAKGLAVKKLETRVRPVEFEIRELEGGGLHFEGYAAVFNSRSEDLGGFTEVVAPGAFRRSLQSRNDVKLLFDHNPANVLASTRAGTMTLSEDSRGLYVTAELAPTTLGRDLAILLKRSDIDSMSFGFSVIRDAWNDSGTERTLNSVRLMEVSIVSWPAYRETAGTVSVRGLDRIAKRANVDADQLADALLKLEEGTDMSQDEVTLLSQVIDKLKPQSDTTDVVEDATHDADMLALKKKKLELLELLNG